MRVYLLRRAGRSMIQVAAVCVALALAAASIRLLPWIASPAVPSGATLAFAQALALAALEVALLVAPAVGASLDIARSTADGSTTALLSLGMSPRRQAAHIGAAACVAAALSLCVSGAWGVRASNPGQLTNEVVASGRTVCTDQRPSLAPWVGVTWLCMGGEPAMVGRLGSAAETSGLWMASSAAFADDLSSVHMKRVRAWFRTPAIRAQFDRVTVTGLIPWMIASPLPAWVRALGCALACVVAAIGAAWSLLVRTCSSRAVAITVGACGPATFLLVTPWLSGHGARVALAGSLAATLLAPLLVGWIFSRPRLLALLQGGTNR